MFLETLATAMIASGMYAVPTDAPKPAAPPPLPPLLTVRQVQISGNHLLPSRVLVDALALPANPISYPQLGSSIEALNQTYIKAGFAFCGVLDSAQLHYDWATGTLAVHVVEPLLGNVRVTGPHASAADPARLAALHSGEPVRVDTVIEFMRAATAKGAAEVSDPQPALDLSHGRVDLTFELR
jgi:hemolysin activation/secretion protein